MSESFNLLRSVQSLDIAPELLGYSGVVIHAGHDDDGNKIEYRAGDQTGTVLEITNEWGSQVQADAIYQKIRGYKYQPYRATGSQLDPSAEIGDAVTVNDTYGGVFVKASTYGKYISADIEAPSKEEVEHEFQTQSSVNRQYERFTRTVRASLSITASKIAAEVEERQNQDGLLRSTLENQAGEISAKVSSEVGNTSSDFWWKLTSEEWGVGTKKKTVFSVKPTGAYVDGEIRASSGKIGGFDIESNYLSYNGQTWNGTNTRGAYIGQSGIQLGKNFKVDMHGNLTASSGTFSGNVYAGNIKYGANEGHMSGSAISSGSISGNRLVRNTVTTSYTSSGINSSLGYADFANGVFNGWNKAPYLYVGYLHVVNGMFYGKYKVKPDSYSFKDSNGNQVTLYYMAWSRP